MTISCIHDNKTPVKIADGAYLEVCTKCARNIHKHILMAQKYAEVAGR